MTMRFSAFGLGQSAPPQPPKVRKKEPPLPIEIQLGSNTVELTPQGWKLDSRELATAQGECKRLEKEVMELRRDLENYRKDAKQSAEQENMASFQNQLLIDMLAVARADQGNFRTRLEQESARHAELSRSLEQAYTKLLAAGLDPGVSDAP
ncbi:unnamed protein product [Ectocarpus sp. 12 AP-2014]